MKLSPHFALWEFTTSQTAERLGIDNTPTPQVIKNLTRLCDQILEPARIACGPIIISSGYRSRLLNKRIGGEDKSGHIEGWCADCLPIVTPKLEFAKWISKNCEFDQIILEFGKKDDPAWIHVSADPRNRKQILQILNDGKLYRKIIL